jgi:peptidoglycan hydrolase-like protein with peptidoglycan-binding domain
VRNVTEIQQRLIALGYLRPGEDDGKFGPISLDAYNHWRASKGAPPVSNASLTQLNIDLFPEEQPGATPRLTPNPVVQAIGLFALKTILNRITKGQFPMLTTMDKAWVAGVVSFVCNYIVNHFWHITIDDGTQGVIVNLIATFILPLVAVWLVPNKPKTPA